MIIPVGIDIDVDMEDIGIMFGVLFGLLIISLIALAVVKGNQNRKDDAEPIRKGHARIVDKPQVGEGIVISAWVMFELDDGERVRLNLKGSEQAGVIVGDTGQLTWQGSRFIRFDREL